MTYLRTDKGNLIAISDQLFAEYSDNRDAAVKYVLDLMEYTDENPSR